MSKTTTLTMVDGVRVVVPDVLDQITPYVLREQEDWFEDEIRFVRHLLQPGRQVVDVGANHGVYTLSMANAVGSTGQVWAFEPASSTAQLLAESIEANGYRHVVLDRSALSDHSGTAKLSLNPNSELNSLSNGGAPGGNSEVVALTTLDACIERFAWHNIDFLKIDAEGEEARILQGGQRFFAEFSPLVEYEIKAGSEVHFDLVRQFRDLGYRSYRLVPGLDMLVPFDPQVADAYLLNAFACKADCAERLAARGHLLEVAPRTSGDVGPVSRGAIREEACGFGPAESDELFSWRHTLLGLPYAAALRPLWEKTIATGESDDVLAALRLHGISRDKARSAAQRFHALRSSFELLNLASQHQPAYLRLASLARVAQEFGARAFAVATLQQLCSEVTQSRRLDASEPFLAPSPSFDSLPPGDGLGNWLLAAALEQCERLESFSSFYSPHASRRRLDSIAALGFISTEMARRRALIDKRLGPSTAVDQPTPAASTPGPPWSLLEMMPPDLQFDLLDVGAAVSERPAYQALVDSKRARLIGFEPNLAECERLNRDYGAPHRFFPHFVGDGNLATFHETNWVLTGSLFPPNTALLEKFQNLAELVTPVATHTVATTRIDDIAEIGNVDLFKIDVQGGELAVFRNALRVLASALVVQTEVEFVELYRGQPLFADVDTFLRSQGFQFHTFQGISGRAFKPLLTNNDPNAPIRQALWCDAVYVRDWMVLEDLDAMKLRKYAVLAHDVLGSFDLAHLVLRALDRKVGSNLADPYLARLIGGGKA